VLALDTSTAAVLAVVVDCEGGEGVVSGSAVHIGAQHHGEQLAVVASKALRDAGVRPSELDEIVVGVGPGPFTGLRVGIVAARVMAAALDIPVRGVCSLDALAATAVHESTVGSVSGARFAVAADARRKEVYWATYEIDHRSRATRIDGPYVSKPGDLPESIRLGTVLGRGTDLFVSEFGAPRAPYEPTGTGLAHAVAWALDAGTTLAPEPIYLRRPDAVVWQS